MVTCSSMTQIRMAGSFNIAKDYAPLSLSFVSNLCNCSEIFWKVESIALSNFTMFIWSALIGSGGFASA
jgi:hypothetical protein